MLNDYAIALLVQDLYDGNRDGMLDGVFKTSGVNWAYKKYPDCNVIIMKGTSNILDIERDFDFPMQYVSGIGRVHGGAFNGLQDVMEEAVKLFSPDKHLYVTGHSLGAMRGHIITALFILAGYKNIETVVFGSPLPGDRQLSNVLAPHPNRSYWNYRDTLNHDFIGNLPAAIDQDPYMHPRERIKINQAPDHPDPWLLLAWHHFNPLYLEGVRLLTSQL